MRFSPRSSIAFLALLSAWGLSRADDERFNIHRFVVEGNTLLAPARVEALVAPFAGPQRVYGHIQKALEALEAAYRTDGWGTVQVHVPEQELSDGVVRLQVSEGIVGKVLISGINHYDEGNIRRTLPQLQEGKAPNMRQISENIQLANDNPAKQVEVVLGVGDDEGTVDAKVNVTEEGEPQKYTLTLDSTGTGATGKFRLGFAYMHANLFNADHVMTFAYTTSPDKPESVKVDVFSLAYRIPFYSMGDSMDFIVASSNTSTPSVTSALGAGLAINGRGDVYGLRWNHYFPRQGEYTSKLVFGFDYKYMNTRCTTNGQPSPIDPDATGLTATCIPYTLRPLSVTYSGQKTSPGNLLDYSLGVSRNIPMGSRFAYTSANGAAGRDNYSFFNLNNNNRTVPDDFYAIKANISLAHALPEDWMLRMALNAQWAPSALPAGEQIGLAGSTAVRGFNERAVAMDIGHYGTVELYTPELAKHISIPGSLKALAFYDFARGMNRGIVRNSDPGVGPFEKAGIGSIGLGLRYSVDKNFSLKFDAARVIDAGPADIVPGTTATNPQNTESKGDWRGHFALQMTF